MTRRIFLTAPALAGAAPSPSARPRAGFAEADITPAVGMEQPGGYGKSFHRSVHDPCKVRAAVFDDGAGRVALVSIDALIVPRALASGARQRIRARCGMAESAVLIAATHSHSSGPVGMVQPGEFDHAPEWVRRLAYEKSSMADAGYLARVEDEIVNAVCRADAGRAETQVSFGVGRENAAAFNRRFRMKNGLTYTHPGKGNPDVIGPAGPVDPEVGVAGAWDGKGRLTGCVVTFACHATTSPGGISANWVYYLEQAIRGTFGSDVVVVFLAGFCGDVTQVDNLSRDANPAAEQWARLVGGRVGAEAVKVLLSSPAGTASPVAALADVWRIARRAPSPARLARALEIAKSEPKPAGATDWIFAKELVMLDAMLRKEPAVEVEVQAVQIGPAVYLSAPGEMFCQLGLDLKAAKAFPYTFPVELANGCVGYVPTEEALGPRGGGYETRLSSYTNLVPDAGTQMVARALALARRLKPGALPERPQAPPSSPWLYGNVPPEVS